MRKLNKIVSVAAALALAGATLSMSACAEDAEKLEIAVTGGGEDSMQLEYSYQWILERTFRTAPPV